MTGSPPPMGVVDAVLERIRAADPAMSKWRISGYRAFWHGYLEQDWAKLRLGAGDFAGWIETYFWTKYEARQSRINQRLGAIVGSEEAWRNAMEAWKRWDAERWTREQLSQAEYDAWKAYNDAEAAISAAEAVLKAGLP